MSTCIPKSSSAKKSHSGKYLKLYISGAAKSQYAIRKVAIASLKEDLSCESPCGNLKFEILQKIATEYAYEGQPMEGFDVFVTYTDEEEEIITLSTDNELIHLVDESKDEMLRLNVRVVRRGPAIMQAVALQSATRVYQKPPQLEHFELIMDTVANSLFSAFISVRRHFPNPRNRQGVTKQLRRCVVNKKKTFDPNFVHHRHTCDRCDVSPIVGYRYHATNVPNFDFCQTCMDKNVSDAIRFEQVEQQYDRKYEVGLRQRNEAKHMRRMRLMTGRRLVERGHYSRKKSVVSCEETANVSAMADGSVGNGETKLGKDDGETECILVNSKVSEMDEDWNIVEDSFSFATAIIGSALYQADLGEKSVSLSRSESSLSLMSCDSFSFSDGGSDSDSGSSEIPV